MSLLWGTAATFKVHEIYIIKERKKKKKDFTLIYLLLKSLKSRMEIQWTKTT